jgi:hypothetical protein
VEASRQFYIAGDQLGFSTFDSLLLYLSWLVVAFEGQVLRSESA